MTLELDPTFPRTAHATGADMILAQQIVDSPEALGVYASCEWDELSDDGKEWIAVIVRIAQARAKANFESEVYNRAIEDAAKVAKTAWLSADYDVIGIADADVAMRLCECAEATIRALAKTEVANG